MEAQIKASLREKEVLLKEIHHRVKNNLQTIVSLLNLQAGYSKDKLAVEVFKNSQERVRAMALIHERLYESRDLSQIDFQGYIHSLVAHLFESYSLKPDYVQLKMQVEDVALDIDTAIPLGLLINELVSNALKHAFPNDRKGDLRVSLGESEDEAYDYTLIVEDNGVGFPGGADFQDSQTLGMVLISSLVKKLKGIMDLDRKNGTRFAIKFKKLKYKKRI
jgi:two-component sensor histidine kinase